MIWATSSTKWLLVEDVILDRLWGLLSEQLPFRVDADDRLLFYFAGHGMPLKALTAWPANIDRITPATCR